MTGLANYAYAQDITKVENEDMSMATDTEYRDDKALNEQAMLVRLRVSGWGGKIADRDVSRDVAERAGAGDKPSNVGVYNKLLVKREATKTINQLAMNLRDTHEFYTMPWDDGSYRLIPISLYQEYKDKMDALIEARNDALRILLRDWDEYVDEAKERLGDLFDRGDYPSKAELAEKIAASVLPMTVPDARHFAAKAMEHSAREAVREDIEKHIAGKIDLAVRSIFSRLKDAVEAISERLEEPEEGERPKTFKNTLVTNLADILDILPDLNLTDNPQLAEIGEELKTAIEGVEPDNLRPNSKTYNKAARETVKERADSIAARLAGYFGDMPDA